MKSTLNDPAVRLRVHGIPRPCSGNRGRPHHQDRYQPVLREDEGRREGGGESQGRQADERGRKFNGDNATQVTAIENMVSGGAKAIIVTPSDRKRSYRPSRRRAMLACS